MISNQIDQSVNHFVTFDKNFGKYDATASEAALTKTQRHTRYQELLSLKQMGAQMQDPYPVTWGDITELAPMQMPGEQLKKMQQRELQGMKQKQVAQQQQQQIQDVTIRALTSEAKRSEAKPAETPSVINKNTTTSQLNQAKAAGEIDDIENNNASQLLAQITELGKLDIERQKLNQPQPLQQIGGE